MNITHFIRWAKTNWHSIILVVLIVLYIGYFTTASFLRYTNFYTGRFDLGNMDQTVWNTAHGRIFQLTNPDGTNIISRLSFHADFLLILLAPFYLIWQDPRMLLLIQTLVLASGAIFVFLLSKDILKNKTLSLVFGTMFLLNPSVEYTNLYDFHAVTLATTFLLGAFYFLRKQKYIWYILFLLLAALTKEQLWIITAFFGLHMMREFKKRKQFLIGLSVFLISVITFIGVFFYAIPYEHQGNHFAFSYYYDLGSTPKEILKTLIFNPHKTFGTLFAQNRLEYLLELFAPFGFVSILAPWYLIFSFPELLLNLLSTNDGLHQIYYQYTAAITPFVIISALFGVTYIKKIFPKIPYAVFSCYLVAMTILLAYITGPLPGAASPNLDMFTKPLIYANAIDDFLQRIPQRYSIAATNNVGSHLSHRQKIFTIPTGMDQADIIVFLLNDQFAQPSLKAQQQMVKDLGHDPRYFEVISYKDFVVFAKASLTNQRLQRAQKPNTILPFLFPTIIPYPRTY